MRKKNRPNPVDLRIGQAVEAARLQAQKPTHDAAKHLNISTQTYLQLEAGHMPFEAHDLFALAKIFQVQVRDLMPQDEALMELRAADRYADAEEVRDLIHLFSGVVSPSMRQFFLAEMQKVSVQDTPEPIAAQRAPERAEKTRGRKFFRPRARAGASA